LRIALFLLAATALGCGGARRSEDPVARDLEVKRDILWKYQADHRFARIEVFCAEGVVTLEGIVTTSADRDDAERIAWGVTSVRKVKSNLRVRSR
jgi:osmotically-inducible protein OsmY